MTEGKPSRWVAFCEYGEISHDRGFSELGMDVDPECSELFLASTFQGLPIHQHP